MANKRISDLVSLPVPTGQSVLPINHQGSTRQITLDNLFAYVDEYYLKSGKSPTIVDDLGNTYFRFKAFSGNFLNSGGYITRDTNEIFQVDNSGIFRNYFSGLNCEVVNLNGKVINLDNVTINDLTVTGDVSSLNITGDIVNITGQTNFQSGVNFITSSWQNPLQFGPLVKVHATGNNSEVLAINGGLHVKNNLTVDDVATFKDNFYVTGNDIRFYGNIILGADQSNTIRLNGGWIGNILPASDWLNDADDEWYQLGNPAARWKNIWAGRGIFHDCVNISGALNITGGHYLGSYRPALNISGDTVIGANAANNMYIHATPTFTSPKVYIQNDLEISGALKIGDLSNDILDINSTTILRAPETYFLQDVYIGGKVEITGDLATTGHIDLLGGRIHFLPDIELWRCEVCGSLKTTKDFTIGQDLTVTGDTRLGTSGENNIQFSGRIASDFIPSQDKIWHLGTPERQWEDLHIGNSAYINNLEVSGNVNISGAVRVDNQFTAVIKSFLIDHPSKEGKKLQYSCLEGPENGVYIRGSNQTDHIELPDYWKDLVDESTITVNLTPYGHLNQMCVTDCNSSYVKISGNNNQKYFYMIAAERKDVPKLQVEF